MLYNLRKSVLDANMQLAKHGLVIFTRGNVSGIDRATGLIAIKPSGVDYDQLKVDDIVIVDLTGKVVSGSLKPSSDTASHLHLYNHFPDIGGIVHTHSTWASIWAQTGRSIPVYGTTHADYFYGEIPCTSPLTDEQLLAEYEKNTGLAIAEVFRNLDYKSIPAVLVYRNGPFAWGADVKEALHHAVVLEDVAKMAYHSEMLGQKTPIDKTLLDRHFMRIHGKDAYHGQKRRRIL